MRTLDQFERRLDKSGPCWLWLGAKHASPFDRRRLPYGAINFNGRATKAHRVAWTLYRGQIPDGLLVLHKCDTPVCCNPEHLWLGTQQNNVDDMMRKGRHGWNSKPKLLRDNQIAQIQSSDETCVALAKQYGVSISTLFRYRRGWR